MSPDGVDALLAELRRQRAFDAAEVVAAKVGRLVGWFAAEGLDAAVVGLSGGVDSAAVLALLDRAARQPGSPLRRVVAVVVPIEGPGATGQAAAADRARRVAAAFGVEAWTVPLAAGHAGLLDALAAASRTPPDGWVAGQALAVERTPVLYGAAALLQAQGHRSVVVGTTNRDEGAYLGFFGKASDGMVDLQPLSDLHKAEVRAVATRLGVPAEVLAAAPTGDLWDGRTDAEVIGAGYDDVELVLRLRELGRDPQAVAAAMPPADAARLEAAAAAVARHHARNAHKYRVGSPAVHLDVLPRGVPGGWPDEVLAGRGEHPPDPAVVPGAWSPPDRLAALDPAAVGGPWPTIVDHPAGVRIVDGVLTPDDCARLAAALDGAPLEPVGVTGTRASAGVGSHRATAFSPPLAAALWARLAPAVPSVRFLGPADPTDWFATADRPGHRTWRVVGLSPVLRFMRYERGGHHLVHHDAGFDYGDGRRTLSSAVFFLTTAGPGEGGELRLVDGGQDHLPVWARDHDDWDRPTEPHEVRAAVAPVAGRVALFDHRRAHDVAPWAGAAPRVVIRADVVYEAVPDGRGADPPPPPKIARDPYLAEVARRWGSAAAYDAGFFDDDDPDDAPLDDVGWLCTPVDHVRRALAAGPPAGTAGPPVVLLATGGFHPVHDGHLELLRRARADAAAAGWWVVGGYLSPGHDQYLARKWGAGVPPASARLAAVEAALAAADEDGWLAADPWEAHHRRVAVNYTDVTARLTAYLRHHLDPRLEVAFVCGGDNARFALAFAPRGRAVVVGRPGPDWEAEWERWRLDPRVAPAIAAGRICFASGDHPAASRALDPGLVDPAAAPTPARVGVRLEGPAVAAPLGLDGPAWRRFQDGLLALLSERVEPVPLPPSAPPAGPVLSLDPLVPGTVDLGVSRVFDLGGGRFLGHAARPGWPPLAEQLAAVPPGRWVLVDDDRATGGTLAFVRAALPSGVTVAAERAGVDRAAAGLDDLLDSRDFLPGTADGGLVVRLLDGALGRVPYLLPYVDPAVRCGLGGAGIVGWCAAVWDLAASVLDPTGVRVADLAPPAAAPFLAAGWASADVLAAVCRDHAEALRRSGPPVTRPGSAPAPVRR